MIGSGIVAPLSTKQIDAFALQWRRGIGYRDDQPVSMLRVIEFVLPRVFNDFDYEIVEDADLRGAEATTSLTKRRARASRRRSRDVHACA